MCTALYSLHSIFAAMIWNTLPDSVVSADAVDTFEIHLDRCCLDQEIKYSWGADIHTGHCSQFNAILD